MIVNAPLADLPVTDLPSAVLDRLLSIDPGSCRLSMCLASALKEDDLPKVVRLQLADKLAGDFRKLLEGWIRGCQRAQTKGDLILVPYDAGTKPDAHEVEFIRLAEFNHVRLQVEVLSSLTTLPLYTEDKDFTANLKFYTLVLEPVHGDPIQFFRQYSPKKELSRSSLLGALFANGHFDSVQQPLFLFDEHVDCVGTDGTMLIFNKDGFQRCFRFYEKVLASAEQTLSVIQARLPIVNFDDLRAACRGNLLMLGKLKNIAAKGYLQHLTMAAIRDTIQAHGLSVQVVSQDGVDSLVFDPKNPKNKWEILRLLDDDYLSSDMTGQNYEVTSKRPHH